MSDTQRPSTAVCEAMGRRAEAAERLAAGRLDALRALGEAITIPFPATVGDGEVYDRIIADRLVHARTFLGSVLGERSSPLDLAWSVAYLRERLAEHPPTGYRTWDDAREGGQPRPATARSAS